MTTNQKPQSKSDAIRAINEEFPGATNATIKKLCFDRWKMNVQSGDVHFALGSESSRRDARKDNVNRKLAETFLSRVGDYRTCLRLLRSLRKEGR